MYLNVWTQSEGYENVIFNQSDRFYDLMPELEESRQRAFIVAIDFHSIPIFNEIRSSILNSIFSSSN